MSSIDQVQSAGALTFSPDAILFLGDNKLGAVFAFETERGHAPPSLDPFLFESIDEKIAAALGVTAKRLVMNAMAVHPVTREPYLSVGVRNGDRLEPAVVIVSLAGEVRRFDLSSSKRTVHLLSDVPDEGKTFRSRAGFFPYPPAAVFDEKARTPLRSMTIVDLKFHAGEVFVAGVSNQEFCSTLRRIPYPFTGTASETQVEIYHLAHGRYETRAPIRTMQLATIDGEDTLVAAYACSPLVTIPVSALKHGAKVRGKTIGDMGNGQPISMVAYRDGDEDKLFITNLARGPMVVPLSGIRAAEGFTPENRPTEGHMLDQSPFMPAGPVGKQVLFVGSSLRADLFSDRFFVSLTRYADTGDLTLETLMTSPLPARLDKIWVEADFPGAPGTDEARGVISELPIRISPRAEVLPANTLRFYIEFPRPAEAHFHREQLWLLDEEGQVVHGAFLVLSQELWSHDGRRLTVLMEPGRIKRGLPTDPAHDPALIVGRAYRLVLTALGQTARHAFRVGDPVLEAIDETRWRIASPRIGSRDPVLVHFDRVMDAALCEDEIEVVIPSGEVARTRASLAADGTALQLIPHHAWSAGEHGLVITDRLEDVCGNRVGEALDHDLSASGRPRAGTINFTPHA